MTFAHFKLTYRCRTYRFAPTFRAEMLLKELKARVREAVQRYDRRISESDYMLCWKNENSNMHLNTVENLEEAIANARRSFDETSSKPPCVRLEVVMCHAAAAALAPNGDAAAKIHSADDSVAEEQSEIELAEETFTVARPALFGRSAMSHATLRRSPTHSDHSYALSDSGIDDDTVAASTSSLVEPSDSTIAMEVDEAPAAPATHNWLLLANHGNDCFLNAAVQYMRRTRCLGSALAKLEVPTTYKDERARKSGAALQVLKWYLKQEGRQSPKFFRTILSKAIKDLEPNFLTTQQDAYEILTKIFDDVIPEEVEKKFHIESASRRRCRDDVNCKGSEQKQSGPIFYQHIERRNQILDLEAALSSDWTAVEGETEPRHCSECCPCCQAKEEGHDEDRCRDCKADRKHYVEENCFRFKGNSDYALVAFNILHHDGRVDWALKENCDLDRIKLMGSNWKAVSVIKHSGSAYGSYSRGHYVTYTKEDDGLWWLHDDDDVPMSIGNKFIQKSRFTYGPGITDMEGVVAILFQKNG